MKIHSLIRFCVCAIACVMVQTAAAQDFGYPKEKAFYKAHWAEVVKAINTSDISMAQYVLNDFNHDGKAELYLHVSNEEEYVLTEKNGKPVVVGSKASLEENEFCLDNFYLHFSAPYQLLLDKKVPQEHEWEQHIYDPEEIPDVWFALHPKVEGAFNIKSVVNALYCVDCYKLGDALSELYSGRYDKSQVSEYVMDVKNGYAMIQYNTKYWNMVEVCYWNTTDGKKLVALHYGFNDEDENGNATNTIERLLFMRYDAAKKTLEPIAAPISKFDFQYECNIVLPRRGKNISLTGPQDDYLEWTGKGFKYVVKE